MSKSRMTFNKRISSAPTFAQKWELAIHGGKPPTAIERLADAAAALRRPSQNLTALVVNRLKEGCPGADIRDLPMKGPEYDGQARERLKLQFADLLFPALLEDNPEPFEMLIAAMATARKGRPSASGKRETGRRLRLALLSMEPENCLSMSTIKKHLKAWGVEFDERHVRRVMRENDINLLKPGVRCQWFTVKNKKPDKLIREMVIQRNGKFHNRGATQKKLQRYFPVYYRELWPTDK